MDCISSKDIFIVYEYLPLTFVVGEVSLDQIFERL